MARRGSSLGFLGVFGRSSDLRLLDRALAGDGPLAVDWCPGEPEGRWRLRAVARGAALELSAFLPILFQSNANPVNTRSVSTLRPNLFL